MLNQWLTYTDKTPNPYGSFRVIDITEKSNPDADVMNFLGLEILNSFRNLGELKFRYEKSDKNELIAYIENYVFPSEINQIVKNVKQGDFGEFLASLIVNHFQKLIVPLHKMRWKFNKDRSVFCTDMIAHNSGEIISDLYYYEIKSRLNINKEKVGTDSNFVTINAHNSLHKDELAPNEAIADFLARHYFELGDYDSAKKYSDIVKSPTSYKKNFELFFIIEKKNFQDEILKVLDELPPLLNPLCVTIVLIDELSKIVKDTYSKAIENAVCFIYPEPK